MTGHETEVATWTGGSIRISLTGRLAEHGGTEYADVLVQERTEPSERE